VLRNIEKINDAKSRRGTSLPALRWQFVVFGHNEHEIPAARALARNLGMEIQFKLNWAEDYSPVRDPELVKRLTGLPAASRSEYHALTRQRYRQKLCCAQLWNMPAINWDGRVLGCSVNRWGDFGAVETSLAEGLNSDRMRYARRMLLGEAAARADIPCFRCHNYRYMAGTGDWMTLEQIESAGQELPIPPAGAIRRPATVNEPTPGHSAPAAPRTNRSSLSVATRSETAEPRSRARRSPRSPGTIR
jgi:hypothetical protein